MRNTCAIAPAALLAGDKDTLAAETELAMARLVRPTIRCRAVGLKLTETADDSSEYVA